MDSLGQPCELVSVTTIDGVPLDGAHYRPSGAWSGTTVIVVHGKTGQFYTGPSRFLPPALAAAGYAVLSINLRIHDLGYTRWDEPFLKDGPSTFSMLGAAWEKSGDIHRDLDAWVGFLREHGTRKIVLIGHSSGGFYAAEWAGRNATARDLAALVLMSPLQTNRISLKNWFPGEGELDLALAHARQLVAAGRGHELLPLRGWYWAVSASTLLDRAAEPPDLFDKSIDKLKIPLMILFGAREARRRDWTAIADHYRGGSTEIAVIQNSEHMYLGFEDEVAGNILQFLTRALVDYSKL